VASKTEQKHRGTVAIIRQIWAQEGIFAFFAGMRAKLVQSVLAAALMFVLKERINLVTQRALAQLAG
jgi:solute carrier family 25 (peroxisomal adenine nucleotide transporter), member 17